MIGKIESQRFRKHPGGVQSIINTFRILLLIGVILSAISVVVVLVAIFSKDISVSVLSKARDVGEVVQTSFHLSNIKTVGILNFEARNFFEWLFLPRYSQFDIYINSLSLVITWQLYRILKEINMDNPFYEGILTRITIIYRVIFYGFVFSIFRYIYFMYVIGDITHKSYKLTAVDYMSSTGYFSLGTWVMCIYLHMFTRRGYCFNKNKI